MIRMSQVLALAAGAGFVAAAALVLAPAGRAAVSPAPSLAVSYTAADLDHALGAFDAFRNRLDGAPRPAGGRQSAAIQGERPESSGCARFAWPHIPQACQTSASGRHLRQIRTIATDASR